MGRHYVDPVLTWMAARKLFNMLAYIDKTKPRTNML